MNRKNWKNIWRRKVSAIALCMAACVMTLSGCSKDASLQSGSNASVQGSSEAVEGEIPGTDSTAMGRYLETPKTTPEGLFKLENLVRLADGSLGIASRDTGMVYISKDEGESWEAKEITAMIDPLNHDAEITTLALAPDGALFFSYIIWSEVSEEDSVENIEEHCIYVDATGQEKEIFTERKPEDHYLQHAVFSEEGSLFLGYVSGKVYRTDIDSGNQENVMSAKYDPIVLTASGDHLIVIGSDRIDISRISTGEQLDQDSVLNEFVQGEIRNGYNMGICLDNEGQIYTASRSGLYGHILGGSVMDQLLDGGLSNLGDPTKTAVSLLEGKDGGFLIAYNDGEIDSYVYDETVSAVPEQQLTIYSLVENDTINKAVSTFRKNHPEAFVRQEIGLTGEESMVVEDAIRNLNASLLAGDGPDIIVLDGMPRDSYIEKGQLKDLTELVATLEESNSYFNNIFTAYKREDGIYALPTRFQIPVMAADKQVLEKMRSLQDLADVVEDERAINNDRRTILGTYTPKELLVAIQQVNAPAWEKDGEFQKEAVLEFLTQVQRIYKAEHQNITLEQEQMHEQLTGEMYFTGGLSYEEWTSQISAGSVFGMISKEQSMLAGQVNSMSSYEMLISLINRVNTLGTGEALDFAPLAGQAENVFFPVGIVGMNVDTKEEELSYDFLKELFGVEVLQNDLGDGFPVNKQAFDKYCINPNEGSSVGFAASTDDGITVDFEANWPNEGEIARLKDLIESLNTPSDVERLLREAVLETGEKVLREEMTPQEGADEIGQKMELYFAE